MTKLGFIFPGQGSQKVGMGKDLYDRYDQVKAIFKQADEVLGRPISQICFEGPQEELTKTVNAQPGIFLVSASIITLLKEQGLSPVVVAGHSLGEITAYYASEVLSLEDALLVIKERGEGMAASYPSEKSGMAAVLGMELSLLEETLRPFKEDPLVCANHNCPGQIVVSGQKESLEKVLPLIKEKGGKAIPLPVSGAFHSPLMQGGADHLRSFIENVSFNDAQTPIILNRRAETEVDANKLKENLPQQVISPVLWTDSMTSMMKNVDCVVECGPGAVLTGLMKKINPEFQKKRISDLDSLETFIAENK